VDISGGKITATDTLEKATFTITKTSSGYTILSASNKYIGRTSKSNGMNTGTSALTNTITFNNDGTVKIAGSGNGSSYTLQYNATSGQNRFRYFGSSQKAICLYKLVETAGTTTTYYVSL
jgi:hypothetical protein